MAIRRDFFFYKNDAQSATQRSQDMLQLSLNLKKLSDSLDDATAMIDKSHLIKGSNPNVKYFYFCYRYFLDCTRYALNIKLGRGNTNNDYKDMVGVREAFRSSRAEEGIELQDWIGFIANDQSCPLTQEANEFLEKYTETCSVAVSNKGMK